MRRGQAATEFLTTYGFSILIIVSGVAGLYYFGVFDFANFVPSACDLGTTIFCPLYTIEQGPTNFAFNVQLSNMGDKRITIDGFSIKDGVLDEYCFAHEINDVLGAPLAGNDLVIAQRQDKEFVFEVADGQAACTFADSFIDTNDKRKYDIRLYYINDGASQPTSVSGTIIDKPQPYTP